MKRDSCTIEIHYPSYWPPNEKSTKVILNTSPYEANHDLKLIKKAILEFYKTGSSEEKMQGTNKVKDDEHTGENP